MTIGLDKAVCGLTRRKTDLGAAAEIHELQNLESKLSLKLGADFKKVFSKINGFSSYDYNSQLALWNIDDIISRNNQYPSHVDINNVKWIAIGDYMIESDIIAATVELERAEIKLIYENRFLSDSLADFLGQIALGKFDF